MRWVSFEIKESSNLSPSQHPYLPFLSPPPPPPQSNGFNLNNKVTPNMLLIIIILAIIFFISGLLHLLVRFLLRPANRDPDEMDDVTALQGQLQQLFNLHDAGVDQSFIDTLPVFNYDSIIGVKDPFDCAVCLCEFEAEDKLRLLPKCSHAFHMDCIDTWLLSHSTCPICRSCLLQDFPAMSNVRPPIVLVLESGSESSREIARLSSDRSEVATEIESANNEEDRSKRVVAVKLGKFKNVEGGGEEEEEGSSNGAFDARRCFSMGSFAYVMDEKSSLQVPIRTPIKKQHSKKPPLQLTPGRRPAISECGGCDSRREFNDFEAFKVLQSDNAGAKSLDRRGNKESFSVEASRRAVSFRFPVERGRGDTRRATSERWGGVVGRCNSLDSQINPPSFARRTLLWIMGRPNKVVHSSYLTDL
ncbi:hypothetical protein SASPL_112061 [Salvia splendens]|uniref:RING-type E3 ubiquitin transferase n=1 Tax=Salvia splendens TaxID=180675 RepID=A0A8X9A5R0_SALSN|nr:RING-H2 finger protein ATL13-like [Salvia splendens]KAG6427814.1 hypothetical protein SASPL_112061 [Salvia splendens]